ncbi:acyl carrier protein [Campylobacter ureolyticus]|uniref:acyl carrier protein n=1 Tax=Campylobacter ureolyticus TaxID=827 RepID=UPI001FC7EF51|nr:acyl carrier protein [Campylobacter ureolyticus]MCZ6104787.1 acyl carrier protein [Campylobacter ureolyticus]MCZ6157403.1 acyl carrier protein [Campylobacter ureolyticus]GKH60022.1 acyl carrier protein [Campylobacter ureolyticus]
MNKEKIFEILKENLIELFEIDDKKITLEARIYEDLDIDSIDAIDLIDSIKKKTGYRLEPNDFRAVRTLGDIVEAVAAKID